MLSKVEVGAFGTARIVLTCLVSFLAAAWMLRALNLLAPGPPFYYITVGLDPMNTSGFLGSLFLYLCLPRRRPELLAVAVLAGLLEAHLFQVRPVTWSLWTKVMATGIGMGLAGVVGLALRSLTTRGADRQRALGYLALACILPLFPTVSGMAHDMIISANPLVWDQFGYAVDGAWGFQPAFVIAGFLNRHPVWALVCLFFYVQLPLLMVVASAMNLRHPHRTYNNVLACLALLGVVGPLLYNVVPMVGTIATAGDLFPLGPPPAIPASPHLVAGPVEFPRNCMPSLHMAWILAVFWSTRWLGRTAFWVGLGAVLFTIGGTIIGGMHYFVDLTVAVPFALFFQALTARATPGNRAWRLICLAWGGATTLTFLGVLRWTPVLLVDHPLLTIGAQVIMVLGSLTAEDRLARATLAAGGFGSEPSAASCDLGLPIQPGSVEVPAS